MSLTASRWTDSRLAIAAALIVACLGLLTLWSGLLAPVDQSLREARFKATDRQPSGDTVFLEIDSVSLEMVGVWPWPRQVHAEILDKLMALGSAEVLFDIDFSSASTPEGDAAFEQALQRAGGYAFLAAFQQMSPDGRAVLNRPLPRFAAHADSMLVNVDGDGTGLLRSVPAGLSDPYIPSVARGFAPGVFLDTPEIRMDFGIDLQSITRISASELLRGAADPAIFAGKQVIVGASAIELRDFFRVPRFGVIPGPMVQLAATETLKANRQLADWTAIPAALLSTMALVLFLLGRRALPSLQRLVLAGLLSMVLVETAAWLTQAFFAVVFDTAIYHGMILLLIGAAVLIERASRWRDYLRQQARLSYLASHDPGSGALSRQALLDALEPRLAHGERPSLLLVHMGRLDQVIASLGHDVGECAAREVVLRIQRRLDIVPARIGLDLFAWTSADRVDPSALYRSIATMLDEPYLIEGHEVILSPLIGMAIAGECSSPAELLRQADVALNHARANDLTGASYESKQGDLIDQRRLQDLALRQALKNGEFHLLFQPQIDLAGNTMVGVEALVRWNSPHLGHVSPADFIPLAEETGLIVALGDWVLAQACMQAAAWPWKGRLSVNVSSAQFLLGDVVESVTRALEHSGFPAERLDLEITESLFVRDDATIITALQRLRGMGVQIALDDFGTGYSSLSYLARLPVDKLKIDQAFIKPLPEPHHEALVESIVLMAKRLNMAVVAEGIETAHQRDYLIRLGCETGQGYLFSRPATPAALGFVSPAIAAA